MPYEWRIDHGRRTIAVRGHGAGTTEDTLALIEGLAPTLSECVGYDFLYDALELRIESSPADMVRVADALFGSADAHLRRFAIVVPPARVVLGRIFAALAHPRGVVADVFGDVDAALEWLAARRDGRTLLDPPPDRSPTPEP